MDPNSLKSERSAKILLTKLEGRYEATRREVGTVIEKAREHGWTSEAFAEETKIRERMADIVTEMRALDAKGAGTGRRRPTCVAHVSLPITTRASVFGPRA